MSNSDPILCGCGCGRPAPIADRSDIPRGYVKGKARRFVNGHARRQPLRYAIEDRGYKTPCWIWQGKLGRLGYSRIDRDGPIPTHRYFYEQAKGSIPEGLHLDHLCRVPSCVNPEHLEPVTCAENIRRGKNAKLNWSTVIALRLAAETTTLRGRDLAEMFGVSEGTVSEVRNYRIWQPEKSFAGWSG